MFGLSGTVGRFRTLGMFRTLGRLDGPGLDLVIFHRHGGLLFLLLLAVHRYQMVCKFVSIAAKVEPARGKTSQVVNDFTWRRSMGSGIGRTPRSFVPPRPLTRPLVVQT